MGRKAREFTPVQVKEMVCLFNAGEPVERIGQQQRPPCSGQLIGRVLTPILGDLRTARAMAKAHNSIAVEGLKHQDYREGFEAGYRLAITHGNLHGLESTREYCNYRLLPWRDEGLDDVPPEFLRRP